MTDTLNLGKAIDRLTKCRLVFGNAAQIEARDYIDRLAVIVEQVRAHGCAVSYRGYRDCEECREIHGSYLFAQAAAVIRDGWPKRWTHPVARRKRKSA